MPSRGAGFLRARSSFERLNAVLQRVAPSVESVGAAVFARSSVAHLAWLSAPPDDSLRQGKSPERLAPKISCWRRLALDDCLDQRVMRRTRRTHDATVKHRS